MHKPSLPSRLAARRFLPGALLIDAAAGLAVAGVLLSVALPSLQEAMAQRALQTQARSFVDDLRFAQESAARLGLRVAVCPGSDGRCAGANSWGRGRLVFLDLDGNGRRHAGEPVLRAAATDEGAKADGTLFDASGARSVAFGPDGRVPGRPGEVHTWVLRGEGQESVRCIRMSNGGHVVVQAAQGACA